MLSILMSVYNERTVVDRCISLMLSAPLPERWSGKSSSSTTAPPMAPSTFFNASPRRSATIEGLQIRTRA